MDLTKLAKSTNRVHSTVVIKAVDDERRRITGIASTPRTDRMGDIVEPDGAEYELPIPFLWQHNHDAPVGKVVSAKQVAGGIEIVAELVKPVAGMPSQLVARLEEAWHSIKSELVRGLSIGFSPIEYSFMDSGGVHFTKWSWHELSGVTIPANAEATITNIKSFDREQLAATGKQPPTAKPPAGASATVVVKTLPKPEEGSTMKTIAEQIAEFEETRKTKSAEMTDIMTKSGEDGTTLDAEQSENFDTLESEVASIDKHLTRLRAMEKSQAATAKPVADDPRVPASQKSQAPAVVKNVKNDEPGVGFARFALSMYAAKGNPHTAREFAESQFSGDTRLQNVMKAAVAAGTTTTPTWAGNLVDYQNLSSEFIDFLRPRTIVGQFGTTSAGGVNIPSLRSVPFNVRIPGKSAAGSASWVGEGYRKPVTSSGYNATTMKWSKIAAICAVTDELDRFSDPSIQRLVRDDLAEAVIERMDVDFVDPAKSVGTGASDSPASVTNGVTPIPSTGNDADAVRADIAALWAVADATNLPQDSAVYITDSKTARGLSTLRNPLGQSEFPAVTPRGGTIDGVPVIVSNYVQPDSNGSLFILAFASEIYLADDGMVNIDVSREATIFMDDEAATETPTAAQLVSMFQTNQMAIRAERYVRWQKRRPQAVAYLNGVNWSGAAS